LNIETREVDLDGIKDSGNIYVSLKDDELAQEEVKSNFYKPNESEWTPFITDDIFHKDGPKFIEERLQADLSDVDLILMMALTNQLWYNRPDDEIREEVMRPYTMALTKHEDRNWLICHKGQIWRCRNEFLRHKTQEKSMIYM